MSRWSRRRGPMGIGCALLIGILMIVLGVYCISQELKYAGYDSMPTTGASEAEEGKLVKIVGTVKSSPGGRTVIWKEVTSDGDGDVSSHYEYVDEFTVSDSSGSIVVVMDTGDVIRFRGSEYRIGDRIAIVGEVGVLGTDRTIRPKGIAPTPDGFSEEGALRYFGTAVLTIGIVLVAAPTAWFLWRRRAGGGSATGGDLGFTPYSPPGQDGGRPPPGW